MPAVIQIRGMQEVLSNLKKAGRRIGDGAGRGLVKGGQFLQAESQRICPVMTGNLRASAFTRRVAPKHVIVGYTAGYAAYVHENLEAAHGKAFNIKHATEIARANTRMRAGKRRSRVFFGRGENQQAKFLERPAKEKRHDILRIVAEEAKRI